MKWFNEGDVVYFISSSVFIKKATVIRNAGGFCTIRFSDGNCGTSGTRVRESKLYRTEEEAKKVVEQHQNANKWRWCFLHFYFGLANTIPPILDL